MSDRIILDEYEKGVDAGREESLDRIAELEAALRGSVTAVSNLLARIAAMEAGVDATNAKYDYVEHWFANLLPTDWDKCMERWAERNGP